MALDTAATVELESSCGDIDTSLNYYLDPARGGHSSFEAGTAGYFRRKFDKSDAGKAKTASETAAK